MLSIKVKTFSELTAEELYAILRLRSEVFVVEQDCVYQDIDGKDQNAIHILGFKADELVGYARAFKPGDYFEEASIGRVVVSKKERAFKYGYDMMYAAVEALEQNFKEKTIRLSAQCYLKGFYNKVGFEAVGEVYLEDGIPHVAMIKE
ncbi:GNAT family N-acetyltransferase [Hyunsoonleella sp. SJ7]|uniref:GNAT family N-acetyltransferase n=1 Tax=Hyunsoonleella aquatilis TaxID=2762758 RepID=A0A923HDF5_9FLAO|nr:GNAT family N-acetyltransferase [Hyunsoonleella aquatilis]MBC3759912.1 GNAT family N-acetyltransferase [Hyunsoonleella aquatilis]